MYNHYAGPYILLSWWLSEFHHILTENGSNIRHTQSPYVLLHVKPSRCGTTANLSVWCVSKETLNDEDNRHVTEFYSTMDKKQATLIIAFFCPMYIATWGPTIPPLKQKVATHRIQWRYHAQNMGHI